MEDRMRYYNPTLFTLYRSLNALDLGHLRVRGGGNLPIVADRPRGRNGPLPEEDNHSRYFGEHSRNLPWQICEIVAVRYEIRKIGGSTKAWKSEVMRRFDTLIAGLVDETALRRYLGLNLPLNDPITHQPISTLAAGEVTIEALPLAPEREAERMRITSVIRNVSFARHCLVAMLLRLDGPIRRLEVHNDGTIRWIRD